MSVGLLPLNIVLPLWWSPICHILVLVLDGILVLVLRQAPVYKHPLWWVLVLVDILPWEQSYISVLVCMYILVGVEVDHILSSLLSHSSWNERNRAPVVGKQNQH